MIRLPISFLLLLSACAPPSHKRLAFNANMFARHGIGSDVVFKTHDVLKRIEPMLQGLVLEARNAKTKTFTIQLDSLVDAGLHGIGGGDADGVDGGAVRYPKRDGN